MWHTLFLSLHLWMKQLVRRLKSKSVAFHSPQYATPKVESKLKFTEVAMSSETVPVRERLSHRGAAPLHHHKILYALVVRHQWMCYPPDSGPSSNRLRELWPDNYLGGISKRCCMHKRAGTFDRWNFKCCPKWLVSGCQSVTHQATVDTRVCVPCFIWVRVIAYIYLASSIQSLQHADHPPVPQYICAGDNKF